MSTSTAAPTPAAPTPAAPAATPAAPVATPVVNLEAIQKQVCFFNFITTF